MAIRLGIMVTRLIMGLDSTIGRTVITVTNLIIITGEATITGAAIMAVGAVAEATGVGTAAGVAGKTSYAYRAFQAT